MITGIRITVSTICAGQFASETLMVPAEAPKMNFRACGAFELTSVFSRLFCKQLELPARNNQARDLTFMNPKENHLTFLQLKLYDSQV